MKERKKYRYKLYRQDLETVTVNDVPIELSYEGNYINAPGKRYFAHSEAASEPDGYYDENDDNVGFVFSNIYVNHETPFYESGRQLNYDIEGSATTTVLLPKRGGLQTRPTYYTVQKEFIDFFGNYVDFSGFLYWLTYSTINYPEGYNLKFIHPVMPIYFSLDYMDNVKGYWAYYNNYSGSYLRYFIKSFAGFSHYLLSPTSSSYDGSRPPYNYLYFLGSALPQAHFFFFKDTHQHRLQNFVSIGVFTPVWYSKRIGWLAGGDYYGATTYYVMKVLYSNKTTSGNNVYHQLVYPHVSLGGHFTNFGDIIRNAFRLAKNNALLPGSSHYYVFDLDNTNIYYMIAESYLTCCGQFYDVLDSRMLPSNCLACGNNTNISVYKVFNTNQGNDLYFVPRTFYYLGLTDNVTSPSVMMFKPIFTDSFYIKVGSNPLSPFEAYVNTGLKYTSQDGAITFVAKVPGSKLKGRKNVREHIPIMFLRNRISFYGNYVPPSFSRSFVIPLRFTNYFRKTNIYSSSTFLQNDEPDGGIFNIRRVPFSYIINQHLIPHGDLYYATNRSGKYHLYYSYAFKLPPNIQYLSNNIVFSTTDFINNAAYSYFAPIFAFDNNIYNTLNSNLLNSMVYLRDVPNRKILADKIISSAVLPPNVHGISSHNSTKNNISFVRFYGILDYWFFLPKNYYMRHLIHKYKSIYETNSPIQNILKNIAPTKFVSFGYFEPQHFFYGAQSSFSELPYSPIYYFSYEKKSFWDESGVFIDFIV